MEAYGNHHGNSGVTAFTIGRSYIDVRFASGHVYRYTYASAGKENVEYMKLLAREGADLSTFISTEVKYDYAAQLR
jgi:hypothetical protein